MVINRWGTGGAFRHLQRARWHHYLTEQGYIVLCADNRGTGGNGNAFQDLP
jgi:dipeptidyl aminopeptidase/acylaminoacyl peptidase